MRRRARVDTNQASIVAHLRALGATIIHTHTIGRGCPDIVVGINGRNLLIEIKYKRARLTPDEITWHSQWRGHVAIVRNFDDIERIVGGLQNG